MPTYSQTANFAQGSYQQNNSYIKSSVFRQEIAKFEINVVREGKSPLPITQVPRVQQGDILKVKLLDEAVNGIKLDQSQWDWTFLVAFINPSHRMVEARDGKEGLLQASRITPDLILMDLAMPEMDGVEATRQLRQRHTLSRTPIFVISGHATGDVKHDAIVAGCAEVFLKPLDVESLLVRIKATLGS